MILSPSVTKQFRPVLRISQFPVPLRGKIFKDKKNIFYSPWRASQNIQLSLALYMVSVRLVASSLDIRLNHKVYVKIYLVIDGSLVEVLSVI